MRGEPKSAHAAIRSLKHQTLLSHSSGGWKSEIRLSAGLISFEASLLAVSHSRPAVCVCVLLSFYKNTDHTGLGPTPMTSCNFDYLFQGPVSFWGLELQQLNVGVEGRHNSAHNKGFEFVTCHQESPD